MKEHKSGKTKTYDQKLEHSITIS